DKAAEILKAMKEDKAISEYAVFATKTFKVTTEAGAEKNLKIELGDHSIFPIAYSQGRAPAAADEIALSTLNAEELSKKTGDVITLVIGGKERKLTVSGIY